MYPEESVHFERTKVFFRILSTWIHSFIHSFPPFFRCKITRTVGTGANVVGGSLTIAGGILTLTTGGLAAPLIIAGIATSSVGAATNIGSSVLEKIIASKQVIGCSCGLCCTIIEE